MSWRTERRHGRLVAHRDDGVTALGLGALAALDPAVAQELVDPKGVQRAFLIAANADPVMPERDPDEGR